MQKEFYDNVCIQVQRIDNLVIASTARKDLAFDFLREISSIRLVRDIFTVRALVKTPEWIIKGVINGVPLNTSPENSRTDSACQRVIRLLPHEYRENRLQP
ncbi:hypothetical protein HPB48_026260 [Haemaphysalis longicornis]|uniref:Uncharacterized protein n=1 Tax=Haemaphysalis longicornis TaxID=44386 RepID=A0A9J6H973_HAELO|nr:hypothetical protein HPB48_026260 [Haemaphysalis longicornis]